MSFNRAQDLHKTYMYTKHMKWTYKGGMYKKL